MGDPAGEQTDSHEPLGFGRLRVDPVLALRRGIVRRPDNRIAPDGGIFSSPGLPVALGGRAIRRADDRAALSRSITARPDSRNFVGPYRPFGHWRRPAQ